LMHAKNRKNMPKNQVIKSQDRSSVTRF
jgi:hypothetical protein